MEFIFSCLNTFQQRERRESQHHTHRKGVRVLRVAFSVSGTWLLCAHPLESLLALQQRLTGSFPSVSWWEKEAFPLRLGFL